jgi:hypothetical protein
MAEAWLRLAQGNGTAIDRIFLEHEIYESNLVENQGIRQTDAHDLTQLKFLMRHLVAVTFLLLS